MHYLHLIVPIDIGHSYLDNKSKYLECMINLKHNIVILLDNIKLLEGTHFNQRNRIVLLVLDNSHRVYILD
jgi:hypothetical protein